MKKEISKSFVQRLLRVISDYDCKHTCTYGCPPYSIPCDAGAKADARLEAKEALKEFLRVEGLLEEAPKKKKK